jgi:cellulose synthase/poly-beta-1,6-N-acetylglucosamine synthase-like glycosyltransferase
LTGQTKRLLVDNFLFYLAIATLLFWTAFGIDLAFGNRSTRFLKDLPLPTEAPSHRVSIIIPARNEERNIEEALQSNLGQSSLSTTGQQTGRAPSSTEWQDPTPGFALFT